MKPHRRTGRPGLQIDDTGVHVTVRLMKPTWLQICDLARQKGISHSEAMRGLIVGLYSLVAVTQLAESGTPEVVGSIPTSDASDPNMGSLAPIWGFEDEWE